jgi:tRNA (guanine37-N1)-methyltransferase
MRVKFDVVTLFPEMLAAVTDYGITRRAFQTGLASLTCWNPRDFTQDAHRTVDDRPYGGGPGMVMLAEPLALAIEAALAAGASQNVIYLSPQGERLTDALVGELGRQGGMTLLCGRYEGVDQRLIDAKVTRQVSVGDYVLSGGELPAMVLIDALVRRIPGALNTEASSCEESFATGMLDWPHYTRPPTWRGKAVPDVLMGGNHATINTWRQNEARRITLRDRPDLIDQ